MQSNDADNAVTDLIRRAQAGDADAEAILIETTYADLRRIARARLRQSNCNGALDTTSLVNEWYLRFSKANGAPIQNRAHYLRYAASVMRSVIVDFARRSQADRRGGGAVHLTLGKAEVVADGAEEIVRVHEALEQLAAFDRRMADVVEMRYFAGLTEAEIAETLDVSERTVRRDWVKARLWLAEALRT